MFFTVELFIDALILVLHTTDGDARKLVQELLDLYAKEERGSVRDTDFYELYVGLIKEVMSKSITVNDEKEIEAMVLKLKSHPVLVKDPELYTNLKKIFTDKEPLPKDRFQTLLRRMSNTVLWHKDTTVIKKMYGALANNAALSDVNQQETVLTNLSTMCSELIQQNTEAMAALDDKTEETRVTFVDSADKDVLLKALRVYHDTTIAHTFKTGLQGFNRAIGGGFRLGSSIVLNSLSHHAKSLMLLKFARWQVTLNPVGPQFKNPTCLFYSLENETPQNLVQMFTEMYINNERKLPTEQMLADDEFIANYVYDEFGKYGWKLIIDRRLGANFGFPELVADFEEYLSRGFTPLMCVIDYMNMMRKGRMGADTADGNHLLVRDLYTNVCNYLKSHNCTLVTAHQLNRKAAEAARMNPLGAVKRFSIDMLSDSTDPQREVDIAIYQHKEFDAQGNAYLTFKVDKVRYNNDIPDKDKYFAYAFHGPMGILDDIAETDRSIDNIYAYDFAGENAKLYGQENVPAVETSDKSKQAAKKTVNDNGDINLY